MARKLKHSKIKNTSILFELLTRQITADVLAGKSTKSVKIVKKYFNEDTELGKELQLYRLLSEKHYESESRANDLINIVLKSRQKISNSKLRNEKYNLIKEIKENYKVEDFFNGRISNYKLLASIYNTFQSETIDETFNPEQTVNAKFTVLEHITSKKISSKEAKAHVLKEYNKSDKDLRLLTYQILVDKFNKKYKTLNESQKSLLKNYINNVSNTNSLRSFVNIEAKKIDTALKLNLPQVSDKITAIKLNEAIKQIDNLTKGKIVNEKQVLTLMRYYELVKELKNVHKT
ncbi:hypothetical protein HOE22_05530 [Candidatus Woesearchaeota archaeon]|jgi:hypothetical protein|nr:hypothetical protein [Candidatus Woesearchaeota archaeon]MBT4731831.1 hypothetical protein [Candidatus Woesearchaeota archaeon]MBT7556516.1 hypothetical protein [Candidatus Woesearchaeota archaeon]